MSHTVLVVGGYGTVGAQLTDLLRRRDSARVLVGGRTPPAAPGTVRIDVRDQESVAKVLDTHRVGTVVLSVQAPDATVFATCAQRGVHVVDLGADPLLSPAEHARLHDVATGAAASLVLGAGLAPGLTNVLARAAADSLGGADDIAVSVLLGAGDHHGAQAVRWTIDRLAERPGGRAKRVYFPGIGYRRAIPFGFADQHSLSRSLGARTTTRLGLDSRVANAGLAVLRLTGLACRVNPDRLPGGFGGDVFCVRADAWRGRRHAAVAATGHGQSRATAVIADQVLADLLAGNLPPGVHVPEQLDRLADLPQRLTGEGITLWRRSPGEQLSGERVEGPPPPALR
ncbi:NAD-dependent epimerase/dehydratase family protein [Saccharomonospora xinjiangensis]|uniref:NAD-dependent epimerase/dehydratase family protein n=1 Tax=Saccharomonospora xinjiangensis TaxID=75294 RepID=UPI00350F4848